MKVLKDLKANIQKQIDIKEQRLEFNSQNENFSHFYNHIHS